MVRREVKDVKDVMTQNIGESTLNIHGEKGSGGCEGCDDTEYW